ncbi:unnamed protein product [Chrysoparadoxa australica]
MRDTDAKVIKAALPHLMLHLGSAAKVEAAAPVDKRKPHQQELSTLLQALLRIVSSQEAYSSFVDYCGGHGIATLTGLISHPNEMVAYWALSLVSSLVRPLTPGDAGVEYANKQALLGPPEVSLALASLLGPDTESATGQVTNRSALIVMAVSDLFSNVLVTERSTTSPEVYHHLMEVLGGRYSVVVDMLRSPCAKVMEDAILLMQALLYNLPEVSEKLTETALSQALLLRHFHSACFSPSTDQRFISRHLCSIWMSGDGLGKAMLVRALPSGMMQYLKMPALSEAELG